VLAIIDALSEAPQNLQRRACLAQGDSCRCNGKSCFGTTTGLTPEK
jgi:hypothetical protein